MLWNIEHENMRSVIGYNLINKKCIDIKAHQETDEFIKELIESIKKEAELISNKEIEKIRNDKKLIEKYGQKKLDEQLKKLKEVKLNWALREVEKRYSKNKDFKTYLEDLREKTFNERKYANEKVSEKQEQDFLKSEIVKKINEILLPEIMWTKSTIIEKSWFFGRFSKLLKF